MKWIFFFFSISLYSQNIEIHQVTNLLKIVERGDISQKEKIQFNKQALIILSKEKNSYQNRKLLIRTASNFKRLNCWNELKKTSKTLLNRSENANASVHIGISYRLLGYYFTYVSKNDSALHCFLKARKYFLDLKDKSNLSFNYCDVGLIYYFNCDYLESQAAYINALKFANFSKKKNAIKYVALINLGIIQTALGEYKEANNYANRALDIAKNSLDNSDSFSESCLNDIGYNYYKMGKYKQSILFFRKALKSLKTPNNFPDVYALLLDNLANSKLALTHEKNVLNLYLKSSKIRSEYQVDQGRNFNRLYISKYYNKFNEKEKAILFAKEALKLSKDYKATRDVLECLQNLMSIDSLNISKYLTEYFYLSDSLQLAERRNRNKFARIAFETDEITIEKDRAVKEKWIVSATASILLLLTSLLFVIRLQRAKQKELVLIHQQQKTDESIYQLINDQQLMVDEGRQAEKKRIAQELHDGIMNRLASTRLNLFILNKSQDSETINKCLGFINNIQDIEKEIRQVAHDLNQEIFSENKGFDILLETLFEDYRNVADVKLFTEIDPAFNWELTESALRMNIYRILQEALQNAYKYAKAKNIFVTLTREGDFARILVHDDGTGFNIKKVKKGMGLKSIADRTKSLHGEFKLISGKIEGTIINVLLPLSRVSS